MTAPERFVCILCKHISSPRLAPKSSIYPTNRSTTHGSRQASTDAKADIGRVEAPERKSAQLSPFASKFKNKASLSIKKNRLYELESIDLFERVLLHQGRWRFALRWPARRLPPPSQPIDPVSHANSKREKRMVDEMRAEVRRFFAINRKFDPAKYYIFTIAQWRVPLSVKSQATHIYVRLIAVAEDWELLLRLVEGVKGDVTCRREIVALVEDCVYAVFYQLESWGGKLKKKINDFIDHISKPYSDQALLLIIKRYLVDKTREYSEVTNAINHYILERGHLPDISVSNKALAAFIERGADAQASEICPWVYEVVDSCLWGHFDHNRINNESLFLLLKYARDRDEVQRILSLALLASKRDHEILKGTELAFLRAIRRFLRTMPLGPRDHVYNLSELMSFQQRLKRTGIDLSNMALWKLLRYSAFYGSSTAIRSILSKLEPNQEVTSKTLYQLLLLLPHSGAIDKITLQHRIIGSPRAWVMNKQLELIINLLRCHVKSEISFIEYIKTLGRCRASAEIWNEWEALEANDFAFKPSLKTTLIPVGSHTLSVFIACLASAGDVWLARKVLDRINCGRVKITPRMIAALLEYRKIRRSRAVGWRLDSPLLDAIKLAIKHAVPWGDVVRRLNREINGRRWESRRKQIIWDRIMSEIQTYLLMVQTGEDLIQAEIQLCRLFGKEGEGSRMQVVRP